MFWWQYPSVKKYGSFWVLNKSEFAMTKQYKAFFLFITVLLLLVACGGNDDTNDETNNTTPLPTADVNVQATPTPDPSEDIALAMTAHQVNLGATGSVADFKWSSNSRYLALAGGAGVLIYDMLRLDDKPRLFPMQGGASLVAFSPNNRHIAAANGPVVTGEDVTQFVYMFDLASGDVLGRAGTGTERVSDLAFSPDSLFLLGGLFQEVRVWNASNLDIVDALPAQRKPTAVAMSVNNSLVAYYDAIGNIQIANRLNGNLMSIPLTATEGPSYVRFVNNGQQLLVVGEFSDLRLYDVTTGELAYTDTQRPINAYVNSANQLVVSAADSAYLFDLKTHEIVTTFDLPRGYPSPDGSLIALRQPEAIKLYDARMVRLGTLRFSMIDRTPYYSAGRNFVLGYRRGGDRLYVIDPSSLELLRVVTHGGRISGDAAAISLDGSLYAVLPIGGPLHVWDTQPWEEVGAFPYEGRATTMAIAPDNTHIAITIGGRTPLLHVLDAATGEVIVEVALTIDPNQIMYTPVGTHILALGDQAVVLLNATTGEEAMSLDLGGHRLPSGALYTPDNAHLLVYGGDGGERDAWINFYDVADDFELDETINGFHRYSVSSIAIDQTGVFMYTVGRDTILNQWDLPSRTLIAQSNIFLDEMAGIVPMNSDATDLLTVTERGVIQIWELGPERLVVENAGLR